MSLLVVLSGFDDSVVLVSWITMLAREINFGKLLSSNRRLSRDKTEYSVYFPNWRRVERAMWFLFVEMVQEGFAESGNVHFLRECVARAWLCPLVSDMHK